MNLLPEMGYRSMTINPIRAVVFDLGGTLEDTSYDTELRAEAVHGLLRIWAEYVFPDSNLPARRLADAAEELVFFYEMHFFRRSVRPEAAAALQALNENGYRLAVISNVISQNVVPIKLAEYDIARYFDPILTSASFGWRKPNERIFLECSRLLGLPPAACAYVGDTVSRDVSGARRAGYGLAIQIKSFLTGKADKITDTEPPDAVIRDLREVLGVLREM